MAGLKRAIQEGFVDQGEVGILDSTAHMLKFITFQEMYFQNGFEPEFNVKPKSELKNASGPSVLQTIQNRGSLSKKKI
jgi:threonine synthase